MKIAFILEQLDLHRGGAEQACAEMARELTRRGLDVVVLTVCARNLPSHEFEIVDMGYDRPPRLERRRRFVRWAVEQLARLQPQIIHAISPIELANVYQPRGGLVEANFRRNLARRGPLAAFVRRLAGLSPKQRLIRRQERYLARSTKCLFLANSEFVARQCREWLGLDHSRVRVIYNGVDIERVRRPDDPEALAAARRVFGLDGKVVGLFAANNLRLKGFDPLLRAVARLAEQDRGLFRRLRILVVTGDKFYWAWRAVEARGLAEQFVFIGPTRQMARAYQLADFVVHPTWYDACSRVVLEAVATGRPAVTTAFNGAAEVLREFGCGIVLDDLHDPQPLVDALRRLADPQVRADLAARCSPAALDRVDMRRHVRELIAVYEELSQP